MSIFPEPTQMAGRLSIGQRSALLNLNETPCLLGCSESYAERLSKPTGTRPALTFWVRSQDGLGHKLFALTSEGVSVKAALAERLGGAR